MDSAHSEASHEPQPVVAHSRVSEEVGQGSTSAAPVEQTSRTPSEPQTADTRARLPSTPSRHDSDPSIPRPEIARTRSQPQVPIYITEHDARARHTQPELASRVSIVTPVHDRRRSPHVESAYSPNALLAPGPYDAVPRPLEGPARVSSGYGNSHGEGYGYGIPQHPQHTPNTSYDNRSVHGPPMGLSGRAVSIGADGVVSTLFIFGMPSVMNETMDGEP